MGFLKNNYFLGLKCLHTNIFTSFYPITILYLLFSLLLQLLLLNQKLLFLLNYIRPTEFHHFG